MPKPARVLVISHGHPDHSKGGGEIAAYNLHNSINATMGFESVFLARHNDRTLLHGGTAFSGTGKPGEVLFYTNTPDRFQFSQPDKARVWRDFRELLERVEPDVVHFHHYLHLGIELLREVKNYNPDLPLVLTLHEYFGICHNLGQMIKTDSGALCHQSSPAECARCFPEKTPQEFFLRSRFIKSHFSLVDQFVSPSRFLIDRYVQWGLPHEKMQYVENLMAPHSEVSSDQSPELMPARPDNQKVHFSYFGQINPFKGVDLLLDAVQRLPDGIRQKLTVDISGSGLENQPPALQRELRAMLGDTANTVVMRGAYDAAELPGLMSRTDWAIVPSKWWENSPMVILEAAKYGVPVICSNIGGMAEKIQHRKTGLHFQVGSAESLVEQMIWAVENRHEHAQMSATIAERFQADEPLEQHLSLYTALLSVRSKARLKMSRQTPSGVY